jgi:NDP-sugar pyrophosphorylase family protein
MILPRTPPGGAHRDADIPGKALVLTAGLGTRLRPLTDVRAKGAVPVNGETLARRACRWLVEHGVHDLVLNLHHLPATITGSVGDGSDLGARVRYSWENPVLGSAGGPRRALPLLVDSTGSDPGSRTLDPGSRISDSESRTSDPGTFLIVNGDTLTDVDLAALAASHAESGAAVTMALIPNPRPDKYGGVQVAGGRWITGFTRAGNGGASYHFIGVQIVEARVFADLEDGVPAETVNALYPRLIARDEQSVGAFISNASFHDIGTPVDYLDTSVELAGLEGDRLASGTRICIDDSATITRSAVWDDVRIGAGAEIIECIVCDGVTIPAGARYRRCAIVPAGRRSPQADERIDGGLLIRKIE